MSRRWQTAAALAALARGEIIAYPTEAVWGLGCDPFDGTAVHRLLQLKQRPLAKGLILVVADGEQLSGLWWRLSAAQRAQIASAQQPTTWLLPHAGQMPLWITGEHDTVAVRVSRHPSVAALCHAYGGPLVSTSANPAGKSPARSQWAARRYFGRHVASYVGGPLGGAAKPSQIRDLESGAILR